MLDVISNDYSQEDTDWSETVECWAHCPDILCHLNMGF